MATAVQPSADAPVVWRPHEGPQRRFLASTAYEALYGGAAGGGKSDALLFGALRQIAHPAYRALLLRRTFPELRELMDRAQLAFRQLGGVWNEQQKRWTFPSGATIEFGYCEAYKDVLRYQGQQFTYIGFDELGQCAEERIWTYLMSRNRAAAPGLILQMRGSANPGGPGHAWLKRRFVQTCGVNGGVITDPATEQARGYYPARLADNPTLLKNDPAYAARLHALPERTRRQLLEGDWDAAEGMALEELSRIAHVVPQFDVPRHWFQWGAFDWGFNHPWFFGWFAADEDGTAFLVQSVTGRKMLPAQIAERIVESVPVERLRYIHAGHDVFAEHKARSEPTPTIAEKMADAGVVLSHANIARRLGLDNFRTYLKWTRAEDGTVAEDGAPRFRMLATPTNLRVFEQLEGMILDPDDPEDALKVDADPETGLGGDDAYDMVRYGLAARPLKARDLSRDAEISAFDPAVLQAEAERTLRLSHRRARKSAAPIDDMFGGY